MSKDTLYALALFGCLSIVAYLGAAASFWEPKIETQNSAPHVETSTGPDVRLVLYDLSAANITDASHIKTIWLDIRSCLGTYWMRDAKDKTLVLEVHTPNTYGSPLGDDVIGARVSKQDILDVEPLRAAIVNEVLRQRGQSTALDESGEPHGVTQVCQKSIRLTEFPSTTVVE